MFDKRGKKRTKKTLKNEEDKQIRPDVKGTSIFCIVFEREKKILRTTRR